MNITQRNYTIKRINEEAMQAENAASLKACRLIADFDAKATHEMLERFTAAIEKNPDTVVAVVKAKLEVVKKQILNKEAVAPTMESGSRGNGYFHFDLLEVLNDRALRITNLTKRRDAFAAQVREKLAATRKAIRDAAQQARDSVMLKGTALELTAALEQFKIDMNRSLEGIA